MKMAGYKCKDYTEFKEEILAKMEESTTIENIKNNSIIECKDFNSLKICMRSIMLKWMKKIKRLIFCSCSTNVRRVHRGQTVFEIY